MRHSTRRTLRLRVSLPGGALGGAQRRRPRLHRHEHGRRRRDRPRRRPGRARVHAHVRRAARRARLGEGVRRARLHARRHRPDAQAGAGGRRRRRDYQPPETFADKPFRIDRRAYRNRAARCPRASPTPRGSGSCATSRSPASRCRARSTTARTRDAAHLHVDDADGARSGAAAGGCRDTARTAFEAPFERIYGQTFENYATVKRSPEVRASGGTDEDAQEFLPACGEEYLIVTSPALRPAADALAAAKQTAGLRRRHPRGRAGHGRRRRAHVHPRRAERRQLHAPDLRGAARRHLARAELPRGVVQRPADLQVTSDLSYSLDGIGTDAFADVMLGRITANTLAVAQTHGREDRELPDAAPRARRATTSTTTRRSPRTSRASAPATRAGSRCRPRRCAPGCARAATSSPG